VEDLMFRDRLAAVVQRLADELGPVATIRHDGTRWTIRPAQPGASPLWSSGDNAGKLMVRFGRASALFDVGDIPKITADEKLAVLEALCRAVVAGRLVERRKRPDGSRWRLTFDDGNILDGWAGWAGWLWSALPWVRVDEEHFCCLHRSAQAARWVGHSVGGLATPP
jgi:hypothetical protein